MKPLFFEDLIDLLCEAVTGRQRFASGLDLPGDLWIPAVLQRVSSGPEKRRPRPISAVNRTVIRVPYFATARTALLSHEAYEGVCRGG